MKKLEKWVQTELENDAELRGSDDLLYIRILEKYFGLTLACMSVSYFFKNYRQWKLPTIETVGRCRRRCQKKHPELLPEENVVIARKRVEKKFYKYAISE